jgi:hypothetical protein
MKKNEECKGLLFQLCVKKAQANGHRFTKVGGSLYEWFWKQMGATPIAVGAQKRQGVGAASGVIRKPITGPATIAQAESGKADWNQVPPEKRTPYGTKLLQQQQAED